MSTSIKKVVVVGPLQSGKSCLSNFLSEYNTKPPSATYMPTVGCRCSPSDRFLTTEFFTNCLKLSAYSPLHYSGSSSLKRKFGMARRERSTALKYGTSLAIERKVNHAPFLSILICLASGMSLVGQQFGGTASVLLLCTIRTEPKKRIWSTGTHGLLGPLVSRIAKYDCCIRNSTRSSFNTCRFLFLLILRIALLRRSLCVTLTLPIYMLTCLLSTS